MYVVFDSIARRRMQLIVDVAFHKPNCEGAYILENVDPYLDGLSNVRRLLTSLSMTGNECLNCGVAYRFVRNVVDSSGVREFPEFTDDLAVRVADFERVVKRIGVPPASWQCDFREVFANLRLNAESCRLFREDLDANIFVDRARECTKMVQAAYDAWQDAENLFAKAATEG